jgi:hypothetical protein
MVRISSVSSKETSPSAAATANRASTKRSLADARQLKNGRFLNFTHQAIVSRGEIINEQEKENPLADCVTVMLKPLNKVDKRPFKR